MPVDVPSPIDLQSMQDARVWAESAMEKRPARVEFFAAFLQELQSLPQRPQRVLELGSGPGFLAHYILSRWGADLEYVALDFSAPMHQLAAERLGELTSSVTFIERSFKETTWHAGLPLFDAVLTNQSVHELRHKQHAAALHAQVRSLLVPGAPYLVCDHYAGESGMKNDQLYMSVREQREALQQAGFKNVHQIHLASGMVLHSAN